MRWKRLWRVLLLVGLISFLGVSAVAAFVFFYGQIDRAAAADVIIVLGAGTWPDGSPTWAQIRRVRHGVALYQKGLAPWMICTGGYTQNHPVSEAQTCVDLALSLGVPASAILREDVSLTTVENVIESQRLMQAHGLHNALLVSDNYHLFRAEWLFRSYGIPVVSSPAQATEGVIPWFSGLWGSYREVGALVVNGVRLITNPP